MQGNKIKSAVVLIALCIASSLSSASCERKPRTVNDTGKPIKVYVSEGQRAYVYIASESRIPGVFPEKSIRDELIVSWSPTPNKIGFGQRNSDFGTGLVRIDGGSGKTYHLQILPRPGCADTQVNLAPVDNSTSNLISDRSRGESLKGLMWYLVKGEKPKGYREELFDHFDAEQRRVMKQGSVELLLESRLEGANYIGTTYQIINKGRTSYRFAIENIDYQSKRIRETIGKVRKVSMLPANLRLGPAPEFVSELYAGTNKGLLFIVSEKQ